MKEEVSTRIYSVFEKVSREARQKVLNTLVEEGWSKKRLAELMQVTPAAVTRFTQGKASPSPESLTKLYSKLDVCDKLLVLTVILEDLNDILKNVINEVMGQFKGCSTSPTIIERLKHAIEAISDTISEAITVVETAEGYSGAQSS